MRTFKARRNGRATVTLAALFGLAACGGGGGGAVGPTSSPPPPPTLPTIASGVFKDSNVSGLGFTSGGQTGTTGAAGGFTYEEGQLVSFSVGGVSIGSAAGQSIVTPIDLVPGGNSATPQVQNIARFLQMLDTDGDPVNGVSISSAVQTMSAMWEQVDFATSDLAADLVTIISDAASVDGTLHTLPEAAQAQSHLESTLLCARSGGYQGTFAGDDTGLFAIAVDALTGLVSGIGLSDVDQESLTLSGTAAVGFDQTAVFITGDVSSGATFSGQFDGPDEISGTWQRLEETGTFSATRFGSAADTVFRFTTRVTDFEPVESPEFEIPASVLDDGVATFDVDAENNVTGSSYSVNFDGFFDLVSGSVSGTTLAATYSDGGVVEGTLDTTSGIVEGTDAIPGFGTLTFSGSGCRLN